MDDVLENIRSYIIKQIVGRVDFSTERKTFRLSLRQITTTDRDLFIQEIKKYPSYQEKSNQTIEDLINDILKYFELCYQRKKTSLTVLPIKNLQPGNIIILRGKDQRIGQSLLQLLYIGNYRFYVLESTQLVLHPRDILEIYNSALWSIDYPIAFKVFRNGKRIPHENLVYNTFGINYISLVSPSIIHRIIDAQNNYSYEEWKEKRNNNDQKHKLDLNHPSINLLLHEYSTKMPIYIDVEEDGVHGLARVNGNYEFKSPDIQKDIFDFLNIEEDDCSKTSKEKIGRINIHTSPINHDDKNNLKCMEDIVLELESKIAPSYVPDKSYINRLVNLFKERGISIMTLEELLNFFISKEVKRDSEIMETAFVNPSSLMRTQNDVLSQQLSQCKYQLNQIEKQRDKLQGKLRKATSRKKIWEILSIILLIILITSLIL